MLNLGQMLASPVDAQQSEIGAAFQPMAGNPQVNGAAPAMEQDLLGRLLTAAQDPRVYTALFAGADRMFNPTAEHGSGQIAAGLNAGIQSFNQMDQLQRQEKRQDTHTNNETRGLDQNILASQAQVEASKRSGDQADRRLDQADTQLEHEEKTTAEKLKQGWESLGLQGDQLINNERELDGKLRLWGAEADKYRAQAAKNYTENMTGEERIINQLASFYKEAGAPESASYVAALDTYRGAGGEKAKMAGKVIENMALFGSTTQGAQMIQKAIAMIDGLQEPSAVRDLQGVEAQFKTAPGATPAATTTQAPQAPSLTGSPEGDALLDRSLKAQNLNWATLTDEQKQAAINSVRQALQSK